VIAKSNYQMGGKQPDVAGSDSDGEPKQLILGCKM
jgi:hypothetical protein